MLEFRIDFGLRYRVYFDRGDEALTVLLGGGTKFRQQRDAETARNHWRGHR